MQLNEDDDDFEDRFLQQFIRKPGDPIPEWGIKDLSNPYEELIKHPFFMKELPADLENYPELLAIQSLLYDGTPDEIATNFKNRGNEIYRESTSAKGLEDALISYSKGIEIKDVSSAIRATLFLNRAAIHIQMQNYCNAVFDAVEALKLDSTLVKGYLRCAKALLALGRTKSALKYVNMGLSHVNENADLVQLKESILKEDPSLAHLSSYQSNSGHLYSETNSFFNALQPELQQYLQNNSIRVIGSQDWICSEVEKSEKASLLKHLQMNRASRKQYLSFPIVFLYPHYQTSDFVADCSELCPLKDYIELVLSQESPWDTEKLYSLHLGLQLYYEVFNEHEPLSTSIKQISLHEPLHKLLRMADFCLVDGVCHIIVVPREHATSHLQHYTVLE